MHYKPDQIFIITQFEDKCSEYSEMVDNPQALILGAMATKILQLYDKIEYLEKRLEYVSGNV